MIESFASTRIVLTKTLLAGEPTPTLVIFMAVCFPVIFVGLWLAVCFLLASVSGWTRLGARHKQVVEYEGASFNASGRIGLVNYNNVLHVGADEEHLYLSIMFLFKAGHPALRIPWSAIAVSKHNGIFFRYVRLRIDDAVTVSLHARQLEPLKHIPALASALAPE